MGTIFFRCNSSLFWRKNIYYFIIDLFKRLCWLFHSQLFSIFRRCFFINEWYNLIFKIFKNHEWNWSRFTIYFRRTYQKHNFFYINLKIINNKLNLDVYHKPTNSFTYLHYTRCHPPHTKSNIALSLARRIVRIVTDNTNNRLQELKAHLLKRKHPKKNWLLLHKIIST